MLRDISEKIHSLFLFRDITDPDKEKIGTLVDNLYELNIMAVLHWKFIEKMRRHFADMIVKALEKNKKELERALGVEIIEITCPYYVLEVGDRFLIEVVVDKKHEEKFMELNEKLEKWLVENGCSPEASKWTVKVFLGG